MKKKTSRRDLIRQNRARTHSLLVEIDQLRKLIVRAAVSHGGTLVIAPDVPTGKYEMQTMQRPDGTIVLEIINDENTGLQSDPGPADGTEGPARDA